MLPQGPARAKDAHGPLRHGPPDRAAPSTTCSRQRASGCGPARRRRRERTRSAKRMVGALCRELFDRLLIVNEHHLRRVLTGYQLHYNTARPHRTSGQLARLKLPPGQRRSASPSTGSAGNKSSAGSRTSTRSPPDGLAATRRSRSPRLACVRAPGELLKLGHRVTGSARLRSAGSSKRWRSRRHRCAAPTRCGGSSCMRKPRRCSPPTSSRWTPRSPRRQAGPCIAVRAGHLRRGRPGVRPVTHGPAVTGPSPARRPWWRAFGAAHGRAGRTRRLARPARSQDNGSRTGPPGRPAVRTRARPGPRGAGWVPDALSRAGCPPIGEHDGCAQDRAAGRDGRPRDARRPA